MLMSPLSFYIYRVYGFERPSYVIFNVLIIKLLKKKLLLAFPPNYFTFFLITTSFFSPPTYMDIHAFFHVCVMW
jgi:hypothetical protein